MVPFSCLLKLSGAGLAGDDDKLYLTVAVTCFYLVKFFAELVCDGVMMIRRKR